MQNGKYYVILPLAILAIALGTIGSTQVFADGFPPGCSKVEGSTSGTVYGPSTVTRTTTNADGVVLTYTAQNECLFKSATVYAETATPPYFFTGTIGVGNFYLTSVVCDDSLTTGSHCADLAGNFGHLGGYTAPATQCSNGQCLEEGAQFCDTDATVTASSLQLVEGEAAVTVFPIHGNGHANTVANFGSCSINPPEGFSPVSPISFDLAFKTGSK